MGSLASESCVATAGRFSGGIPDLGEAGVGDPVAGLQGGLQRVEGLELGDGVVPALGGAVGPGEMVAHRRILRLAGQLRLPEGDGVSEVELPRDVHRPLHRDRGDPGDGQAPPGKAPRVLPDEEDDAGHDGKGGEEGVPIGQVQDEGHETGHRQEGKAPGGHPQEPGGPPFERRPPEEDRQEPPGGQRDEEPRIDPTDRLVGVDGLRLCEHQAPAEVPPGQPEHGGDGGQEAPARPGPRLHLRGEDVEVGAEERDRCGDDEVGSGPPERRLPT